MPGDKLPFTNKTDLHFSTSKTGIPNIGLCGSFATGLVTSFAPITNAASALAKSLLISSSSKTHHTGHLLLLIVHSYVQAFYLQLDVLHMTP